jgi:hypothetical protein
MLNIEVHGIDLFDENGEIDAIVETLKQALRPEIAKRVVITNIGSVVRDLDGQPQPFLRFMDSNPRRARNAASLFPHWNVEVPFPTTFFPKRTSETKKIVGR